MCSSSAAEKTAKFHGDQKTLNNDLMPLILHMIFWQDIPARWAHGLPWWPWTAINNVIYELVKYFCIFVLNVLNIKFTATTAAADIADTDTDTDPPRHQHRRHRHRHRHRHHQYQFTFLPMDCSGAPQKIKSSHYRLFVQWKHLARVIIMNTETEMLSYWWHFCHWLHQKLPILTTSGAASDKNFFFNIIALPFQSRKIQDCV